MKPFALAVVVALWPGAAGVASAQRPVIVPNAGWGEKVGWVADLPPQIRAEAHAGTGRDLAVGYLYHGFFVFGPGMTLWTEPGQYVLFDKDVLFFPKDDEWEVICGPGGPAKYGTPLGYKVPSGLVGVAVMIAVFALAIRYSPFARAKRMLGTAQYQEALKVYAEALPTDAEPDRDDRRDALDQAVGFLVATYHVPEEKARKELRFMIGEVERAHSADLRAEGAFFEEAGEWAAAADRYERAAEMMAEWDEADAAYLRKCVARVRAKLPPPPPPPNG